MNSNRFRLRPHRWALALCVFAAAFGVVGRVPAPGAPIATPEAAPSEGARITEFMANNQTTLADEDGDFRDWLEIHNGSDSPVNLGGWHLTDNPGNPDKWTFPSVDLPAG